MTVLDDQPKQVKVRGSEWRAHHARFRDLAERTGEWAGIPLDVEGFSVQLEERHPYREAFEKILSHPEPSEFRCSTDDVDETAWVRNSWWSHARQARVYLYQRGNGRVELVLDRAERAPGRRLNFAIGTVGVSSAWSIDAEMRAREKLKSLIPSHLYEMYELTGSFLETSPRSGVTYVLRRCRPTIAMVPSDRHDPTKTMRVLAVLCLHPLGYYVGTFAGSMVPTDDAIAHLMMIRGDEYGFWRRANQHPLDAPEAGL